MLISLIDRPDAGRVTGPSVGASKPIKCLAVAASSLWLLMPLIGPCHIMSTSCHVMWRDGPIIGRLTQSSEELGGYKTATS